MFRQWICGGLCAAAATIGQAGEKKTGHRVEGLRLGDDTTVIQSPLNDLGTPDYIAALNERLARDVAPADNFWTAFCETLPRTHLGDQFFEKLVTCPGFERACSIPWTPYCPDGTDRTKANAELDAATTRTWKSDELPLMAAWVNSNQAAMTRIAEAARRPKEYAPLIAGSDGETMAHVLLPHVQQTRDAARLFTARAFLALGEGRDEDAWQDVLTVYHISKHLRHSPFVIGTLVGLATSSVARIPTEAVIADRNSTPEELARRWRELAPLLDCDAQERKWLIGERYSTLDLTLAIRSGRIRPKELIGDIKMLSTSGGAAEEATLQIDFSKARESFQSMMLRLGDVNESLAYTNRYHDSIAAAFGESEYLARKAALQAAQDQFVDGRNPDDIGQVTAAFFLGGADAVGSIAKASITHHFAAAYLQCNNAEARQIARSRLLHAAFAAELFSRSAGNDLAGSDALDEAIQVYAASSGVTLPPVDDPHSGSPFRLVREADRLVIYGVGENGKSDGGKTFGEGEGCDDLVVVLKRSP